MNLKFLPLADGQRTHERLIHCPLSSRMLHLFSLKICFYTSIGREKNRLRNSVAFRKTVYDNICKPFWILMRRRVVTRRLIKIQTVWYLFCIISRRGGSWRLFRSIKQTITRTDLIFFCMRFSLIANHNCSKKMTRDSSQSSVNVWPNTVIERCHPEIAAILFQFSKLRIEMH